MIKRGLSISIFILMGSITHSLSQEPVKPYVINYDNRTYQADYQNWSISVAPDRKVYIGNNQGLLSFDGANWALYKMPEELVVRSVRAINDSIIYVGAFEEFGYWKKDAGGELSYFSLSKSLEEDYFHNDEIWRIVPLEDKIYFQSFRSIFVYDGKKIDIINPEFTIVLLQKARERLFIHGVGQGLFELTGDSLKLIPSSHFLANDEIKVVLPYGKEDFLIGSAGNGLYIFDNQGITPWKTSFSGDISKSEINNGIKTNDFYVIGTIVNGIYIFNEKGRLLQHLNTNNQLLNNTILSLASDGGNNFWAGLDHGIDYVQMNNDLDYYIDQTGMTGSVFSASLFKDQLYIGTNRGLYRYKYDPLAGFCCPELIEGSQGQVNNLKVIDGELLCGHSNGTYKVLDDDLFKISDHNGGYQLRKIEAGDTEYLIQSTYSPLIVYEKTGNGWKLKHAIQGFLEPITYFEIDYLGNIWGNHATRGIFKLKLTEELDTVQSIDYIGKENGLPTERKLFVSKLENRIVITTGNGIYTYDDLQDTVINYKQLNQQLGEYSNVKRIIPIRKNNYWFILEDKIGWFQIDNFLINKVYEYNLTQQDAFLGSNFPEIVGLNDSLHLFCMDNGFGIFREKRIAEKYTPPRVTLHKIKAKNNKNEEKLLPLKTGKKKIKLSYQFGNIEIRVSTDQRIPLPQFNYYLEGLEETWTSWTDKSSVNYTRLPYGKYTFHVKTRNIRCMESTVLSYPFGITPPLYASATAKIIYILIILFGGFLLRIIFVRRLNKKANKLRDIEKRKREHERIRAEQKYMQLKNEKLSSELKHQNIQLANRAMTIIQKNEFLNKLKNELIEFNVELNDPALNRKMLKLFRMMDNKISSGDDWQEFEIHFDQANQHFFKRLKTQYPDLTPYDLRLCAYLRMNLSSKEIAPLLNISVRGVEIKRYRLRKRLSLDSNANLIDFLLTY